MRCGVAITAAAAVVVVVVVTLTLVFMTVIFAIPIGYRC